MAAWKPSEIQEAAELLVQSFNFNPDLDFDSLAALEIVNDFAVENDLPRLNRRDNVYWEVTQRANRTWKTAQKQAGVK